GRQSTEERQNLRTPKLLAQNRRSLCIDPVHLKNMLRQVQSDRSNLAHGWLPFAADSIRQQFDTQMPQGGHPPHHSITSSAAARSVNGTVRPSTLVRIPSEFLLSKMKIAVVVRQLDSGHILWCGRLVRGERAHGIRVVRGVQKMLDVGRHGVI